MSDNYSNSLETLGQTLSNIQTRLTTLEDVPQNGHVQTIHIETANQPTIEIDGPVHEAFHEIVTYVRNNENVCMVGPSGSGKTTIAHQIAKAVSQTYFSTSALLTKEELMGYKDVTGTYVTSTLRRAADEGGVFNFEELDDSAPEAIIPFHVILDREPGRPVDFPDGMVEMHPDFRVLAAANTYGKGADRMYVGRTQLDAATIERFAMVYVDYDEKLEDALVSNKDWLKTVRSYRYAVESLGIRHVISPRASIKGSKMLAAGLTITQCEDALVWKGLESGQVEKIKNYAMAQIMGG